MGGMDRSGNSNGATAKQQTNVRKISTLKIVLSISERFKNRLLFALPLTED